MAFLDLMDSKFGKGWVNEWIEKEEMLGWIPVCGNCGGERKRIEQKDWSAETLRRYKLFVEMGKRVEQVVYCEGCQAESILFEAEEF